MVPGRIRKDRFGSPLGDHLDRYHAVRRVPRGLKEFDWIENSRLDYVCERNPTLASLTFHPNLLGRDWLRTLYAGWRHRARGRSRGRLLSSPNADPACRHRCVGRPFPPPAGSTGNFATKRFSCSSKLKGHDSSLHHLVFTRSSVSQREPARG